MIRDPLVYLHDILDSIKNIEEDTKDITEETFSDSRMLQQVVVRNLEIIGEAVKQLPKDFKDLYPVIPWRKIVAMRNKIIHEYFGLKLDVVWTTIQENLPVLKKQIEELLKKLS